MHADDTWLKGLLLPNVNYSNVRGILIAELTTLAYLHMHTDKQLLLPLGEWKCHA